LDLNLGPRRGRNWGKMKVKYLAYWMGKWRVHDLVENWGS